MISTHADTSVPFESLKHAAREAGYRQDWRAAISVLVAARDERPEEPQRHVELGLFLAHAEQHQHAERVLAEAVDRFPSYAQAAIEHATLAAARADWDEALLRWRRVRERFPDHAAGWVGAGAALLDAGRADEAEAIFTEARKRFPDSPDPAVWYVSLALRAGQWAEAERRFAGLADAFPTDVGVKLTRQKLDFMSRLLRESDGEVQAVAADASSPEPDRSELLMRFESLGGDCEFGMVQRRLGLEPVGLFRFAGGRSGPLLRAIETRCDGIGDPEHTSLYVRNRGREYVAIDTRLNIVWRTSAYQYAADRPRLLQEQCRQLTYLRRKLVGEFEAAAKIFVYTSQTPLDATYCEALARAVQQYSPAAIVLCVGPSASREDPRVSWGGKGLLLAERSCVVRHWCWADDVAVLPYREWLHICTRAEELCRASV
jgi:tetratricopeptide (TPR) repeat protein